jgi:hypothetical protein
MIFDHNLSHQKINFSDNTIYVLIITFIIFAILFYLCLLILSQFKTDDESSLLPDNEKRHH